jgi:hypothetical protein
MAMPTVSSPMCLYVTPRLAMTRENSLICDRFRLLMNAVRRPLPENFSSG